MRDGESDRFVDLVNNSDPYTAAPEATVPARGLGRLLAAAVVTMAAAAADRPVPPPATAGAADVMFVIDTTGSMTPYLEAAVDSAGQTADALHAVTPDARVGLVEYRDHGDAYPAALSCR